MRNYVAVVLLICLSSLLLEANVLKSVGNRFLRRPYRGIQSQKRKVGQIGEGGRLQQQLPPPPQADSVEQQKFPEASVQSNYHSQCFLKRGPSLSKNPTLFFYSAKRHSSETSKCHETTELELKASLEKDSSGREYYKLKLESSHVQQVLIDTALYDGSLPTYLLVHGFMASWNSDNWMCEVKDLVLGHVPANVFIVDWSGGSKPVLPVDYSASVGNTKYVAQILAQFIEQLMGVSGQRDASNFHLIGHSLGAHISGYVGYSLGGSLGRVIGLDPAGPCFSTDDDAAEEQRKTASKTGLISSSSGRRRLSPASARYVLALHTDTSLFGLNENCGHVDVYVNGGYKQPDCGVVSAKYRFAALLELNFEQAFDFDINCAHSYAHEIVDTFKVLLNSLFHPHRKHRETDRHANEKCLSMAFECGSWRAFQAGECGFCLDDDWRCVFAGISYGDSDQLERVFTKHLIEQNTSSSAEFECSQNAKRNYGDDSHFNEEEHYEHSGKDSTANKCRRQYFVKSGAKVTTCMHQYQIVIAAQSERIAGGEQFFFLDLALDSSGLLSDGSGKRLNSRLVQVSHRLDKSSLAYKRIRDEYQRALLAGGALSSNRADSAIDEQLEFFTAKVSFEQAPESECETGQPSDNGKHWQICKLLANLREVALWAAKEINLVAVKWVAMNYMSGANFETRWNNSYIMQKSRNLRIEHRDQMAKSSCPYFGELSRAKTSRTKQGLDSFLSKFDKLTSRGAFRSSRTNQQLKFRNILMAQKFPS